MIRMERTCKHKNSTYTVKRLKMLEWILENTPFEPIRTTIDPNNWRYKHWEFANSPEFEAAVERYFEELNANKNK